MTAPPLAPTQVRIPYHTVGDKAYVPTAPQIEFHTAPERIKLYGGAV